MLSRSLLAVAAIALSGPAVAQDAASILAGPNTPSPADVVLADDIEDAEIVALEGSYTDAIWEDSAPLEAMIADLSRVGEVEDIALAPDGRTLGLTTDVGGFLGLGEKTVLIPLDDIRLVRSADDGDVTIVIRLDQDGLTALPDFERLD